MILAWAMLLFATAIALSGGDQFSDPVLARLRRLVPARVEGPSLPSEHARRLEIAHRALAALDFSFGPSEVLLRSLGVVRLEWILAIEILKIVLALAAGVLALWLASFLPFWPVQWLAPLVGCLAAIILFNRLIGAAANRRRTKIRRELALGIEMLCIFLESGQSLDQAFRSFSEICGEALPHLAGIQKALVSELDNGVTYEKAVEHWADNLNAVEAKPLAALFADSLLHGAELVPHLRQFSLDLIEQRISAARASIGVKSSQLTLIMVVFFLPAVLAFVTAPAITGVISTLEMSR